MKNEKTNPLTVASRPVVARYIIVDDECRQSGRHLASRFEVAHGDNPDGKDWEPWWRHTGGVMGGAMSFENAYISIYAKYHDKHARDLSVGEECEATFALSGEKRVYTVVRVDDGERPEHA